METSFFAMRCKEVINVVNGKSLGRISDMVFDMCTGQIFGLLVPSCTRIFNIFRSGDEIFIPYQNICKIGEDVILVELIDTSVCRVSKKDKGQGQVATLAQQQEEESKKDTSL